MPMDEDDDVVVAGQSGAIALVDFPHARNNCVTQAWVPGNFINTCANCYCYVCDAPASTCGQWAQHCAASHTDAKWRKERERLKQARLTGAQPAPAPARAPAAAASQDPLEELFGGGAAAAAAPGAPPISCESLLQQVQQVWPVETPAPAGLQNVELRPYQRQSLAFMLQIEQAPDDADTVGQASNFRRGWTGFDPSYGGSYLVRGGWLADEVGMGKTAVCIALILANPLPAAQQSAWDIEAARDINPGVRRHYSWMAAGRTKLEDRGEPTDALKSRYTERRRLKLKATLIMTKNSLIGQWRDEFEKFAPQLNVVIFHSGSSSSQRDKIVNGKVDLSQVDVILTTPGSALTPWLREVASFHRTIVDEAHESLGNAADAVSGLRWAVTGEITFKTLAHNIA